MKKIKGKGTDQQRDANGRLPRKQNAQYVWLKCFNGEICVKIPKRQPDRGLKFSCYVKNAEEIYKKCPDFEEKFFTVLWWLSR